MDLTRTKLAAHLEAIEAIRNFADEESDVLFSLLIRTQGNRSELLQEALCSVFAQKEQSFEVLVLLHVPNNQDLSTECVHEVVRRFPESFQKKVRVLKVNRTGRSSPLNTGIDEAKGELVCILDDDDLLYDNHFEAVARVMRADEGALVFQTYSSRRHVDVLDPAPGRTFPYTINKITPAYNEPFDAGLQMHENLVPICNFFFSRNLVNALGIRLDEQLEVMEDWKFLMDINRYARVLTVPCITTAIGARANDTNTVLNPAYEPIWRSTWRELQQLIAGEPRLFSGDETKQVVSIVERLDETSRELLKLKARRDVPRRAWKSIESTCEQSALYRWVHRTQQMVRDDLVASWRLPPRSLKDAIDRVRRRSTRRR